MKQADHPNHDVGLGAGMPRMLTSRYRIERLLGAGGMGVVYRARDLLGEQFGDPEPYVAIKVLNDALVESPDANALLYSEFALTRRLHHKHLLRVHAFEVDSQRDRAFFTMELMRGLTLDRLLCERPHGMPSNEVREIALPLLDALDYAHSCGVLHGDLKPSNVMLCDDGVRLFDFGLGQSKEGTLSALPQLSREHFQGWTPHYAAPELQEGAALSVRADMYGIASVIYELAGGKPPPRGQPSTQSRSRHAERRLPKPAHLPGHCWPALQVALEYDVEKRTITTRELHDALSVSPSWLRRRLF